MGSVRLAITSLPFCRAFVKDSCERLQKPQEAILMRGSVWIWVGVLCQGMSASAAELAVE
jgi:hypothetical protein